MSKKRKTKDRSIRRRLGRKVELRKVAILTPCDDRVATPFHASLVAMLLHTLTSPPKNFGGVSVMGFGSSVLPSSREQLAKFAIDSGSTHTLWIDSDMKFPKETLNRFLSLPHPVVGVNALTRRPTYRCTAQVSRGVELETTADSTGVVEVYRMGFGIVWVATEVFKIIEPPRFDLKYLPQTNEWRGEDYVFFEKAREHGYRFFVDQDLSKCVEHIGAFGYSPLLLKPQGQPEGPPNIEVREGEQPKGALEESAQHNGPSARQKATRARSLERA